LRSLTNGAGVQRHDLLEALTGELRELQRCWSVNLSNGLAVAQQTIVINLREHISKLTPPPMRGEFSVERQQERYRHAVAVSFNAVYGKAYTVLSGSDLSERRTWLAGISPKGLRVSVSTSQRYLNDAINQLGKQILEAGYKPVQVEPSPEALKANSLYIPRPELYMKARAVLDSQRLLVLIGEPGTGKTVLAKLLTSDMGTTPYHIIRCGKYFMDGVVSTLSTHQLPWHGSDAALRRQLANLMSMTQDLLIIFDGVTDWNEVEQFVESAGCQIIATSNRLPPDSWEHECNVNVRDLQPEEALRVALTNAARLSDEQAKRLTATVHYRPIAVAHTSAYLGANGGRDVDSFISSLETHTALVLDSVAGITEQSLRTTYEETIEELREKWPLAASLLGFLVAFQVGLERALLEYDDELIDELDLPCNPTDRQIALTMYSRLYVILKFDTYMSDRTDNPLSLAEMACEKAWEVLANRMLIEQEVPADRMLVEHGVTDRRMHALTASIFYDMLRPELERDGLIWTVLGWYFPLAISMGDDDPPMLEWVEAPIQNRLRQQFPVDLSTLNRAVIDMEIGEAEAEARASADENPARQAKTDQPSDDR
jgi:hypothetical protein